MFRFGFLPHAGPDIGEDKFSIFHRRNRIFALVNQFFTRVVVQIINESGIELVVTGCAERKLNSQLAANHGQRIGNVIAVTQKRHFRLFNIGGVFLNRQHVSQRLAGVRHIGQPVDDRAA